MANMGNLMKKLSSAPIKEEVQIDTFHQITLVDRGAMSPTDIEKNKQKFIEYCGSEFYGFPKVIEDLLKKYNEVTKLQLMLRKVTKMLEANTKFNT